MKSTASAIVAIAIGFCLPLTGEESVDVLRSQVEELRTDLDRPLNDFNKLYEAQLNALKEQAQQAGDLDLAIEVSSELASYQNGGGKVSTDPKLSRLQGIYAEQTAKITKERSAKEIALLNGYKQRLNAASEELTKAGDLETAIGYRNESIEVAAEIASITAAAAASVATTEPDPTPEPTEPEKEGPEFVAGVYQLGEHFGPRVTFDDRGRYDASWMGSGRWKPRSGGTMELNGRDKFVYDDSSGVWRGVIDFGGEKEIVLKLISAEKSEGKNESDRDDDPRRRGFPSRGPRELNPGQRPDRD